LVSGWPEGFGFSRACQYPCKENSTIGDQNPCNLVHCSTACAAIEPDRLTELEGPLSSRCTHHRTDGDSHTSYHLKGTMHRAMSACTVAARNIEPLGSIVCGRSKLEISERSQVLPPQLIDPSCSIVGEASVCDPCMSKKLQWVTHAHVFFPRNWTLQTANTQLSHPVQSHYSQLPVVPALRSPVTLTERSFTTGTSEGTRLNQQLISCVYPNTTLSQSTTNHAAHMLLVVTFPRSYVSR
jgi:hypothetical protein